MPKQRQPKTIGILADLHCGSRWGLLGPESEYGKQNPGQRYLWDCWCALAKAWPRLDLLILNGDLIDGKQYRSKGTGVVTADMGEQAEIAEECLAYLIDRVKPRKIVRTEGTPYHEGFDGALKDLDKEFGIVYRKMSRAQKERRVGIVHDIELADGVVLNTKHQPEGSAALYMGTVQDRETLWATITEMKQGLPRADFIVRSHLHTHTRFYGCGKEHVLTPCFQLQSAYAKHRRYYRWHPTVGALLMLYTPIHDHKYIITKQTFPLPTRRAVTYAAL
jgi:hypothetical protein